MIVGAIIEERHHNRLITLSFHQSIEQSALKLLHLLIIVAISFCIFLFTDNFRKSD